GTSGSGSCICCNRTRQRRFLARKGAPRQPAISAIHAWLASAYAYALKGDTERATADLAEARKVSGDGRFASIARWKTARRTSGTEDPRLARRHLPCRVAQGKYAGRMTDAALKTQAFDPDGQPRTTSAAEVGIFRPGRQREDCLSRGRHGNIHR